MGPGPIERRLLKEREEKGTLCLALIDSEGKSPAWAGERAKRCEELGADAILLGGSTAIDALELDEVASTIKAHSQLPLILFPGNSTAITPHADAILFTCLLNSDNPYFITQAQALGALTVRKYGIEAIPTGYLLIGEGGSIGFVGRARGVPLDRPHLAVMHALAAQYMGMRCIYLEAGSGSKERVPPKMIEGVRNVFDGFILVGGGLRGPKEAEEAARAGADALVFGTLVEEEGFEGVFKRIVEVLKEGGPQRPSKGSDAT